MKSSSSSFLVFKFEGAWTISNGFTNFSKQINLIDVSDFERVTGETNWSDWLFESTFCFFWYGIDFFVNLFIFDVLIGPTLLLFGVVVRVVVVVVANPFVSVLGKANGLFVSSCLITCGFVK